MIADAVVVGSGLVSTLFIIALVLFIAYLIRRF